MDAGGIEPERHEIAQRYIPLKKAPQNPLLRRDLFYFGPLRAVLPPSDSPINFSLRSQSTTQPCLSAGFRDYVYFLGGLYHLHQGAVESRFKGLPWNEAGAMLQDSNTKRHKKANDETARFNDV